MGKTENFNISDQSVSPAEALSLIGDIAFLDVRKPRARAVSGEAIAGSQAAHPFDALNWKQVHSRNRVIVYCVHGHEVSQAVCGYLCDEGIDARFLSGGFETWKEAGYPVEAIGEKGQ